MTTSPPGPSSLRNRRLLICVFYQGPWDRLSGFFWGVKKDNTLRWEIPANPRGVKWVLARLGDWTDKRDHAWREKYAQASRNPPDRWKRRVGDDQEACRLPDSAAGREAHDGSHSRGLPVRGRCPHLSEQARSARHCPG